MAEGHAVSHVMFMPQPALLFVVLTHGPSLHAPLALLLRPSFSAPFTVSQRASCSPPGCPLLTVRSRPGRDAAELADGDAPRLTAHLVDRD